MKKEQNQKTYGILSNIFFMAKRMKEFDKTFFLFFPLPMITQVGMSVIAIYTPKIIIDSLTTDVSLGTLLITIGLISLLLFIFQLLSSFSKNKINGKAMSNRINTYTLELNKTRTTDYENIASQEGQNARRKTLEALQSDESGTGAIVNECIAIFKNFSGLIMYGIILAWLNPYIVLMLFAGAVINLWVASIGIKYEHKHKDDYTPLENKIFYMREKMVDVSNAKDIRIYSMANWLTSLFKGFIGERHEWHKKVAFKKYTHDVVDTLIMIIRDGVAYAYLIYKVLNGLSVGDFALYFGAITGFSVWLSGISQNITEINRSSLQISDLRSYIDIPERSNRGEGLPIVLDERLLYSIEFKSVSYKYSEDDKYVIENLSFKIEKGEKLAVVGVNGAGKTTVIKLMCGLIFPNTGEILINGINVNEFNIDEFHKLFSVVFQDACIMSFTIAENISMQPIEVCQKDKVDSSLEKSGLKEKVDSLKDGSLSYINNIFTNEGIDLSGGEKQKLMLARALYKDAPILILDEPTAALDPIAESKLYEEYAKMTENKTSIYISHRLASTRFCDRIIFIEDGKILESGNHDELMKEKGKYAHMFDVQSHYYANDKEAL